ncbi:hypothetical protein [Alicyclobacillus sp. ALC3]|nr:hypothetical protein [Alicyclobacillus sp. ALC3]WDL97866.1 hypothetical protein JC200_03830 [Alicyclobacillus sp. ALC3]
MRTNRTRGLAGVFVLAGAGLVFWRAMVGYLNNTYGPGAPYYRDRQQ